MKARNPYILVTLVASLLLFSIQSVVSSETAWEDIAPGAKLRLISSNKADENGSFWAAIQLDLADGWKTYWRNPGETGIPLTMDWQQSLDVVSADIRWPFPKRSEDYGYVDYVYEGRVTLPVELKLADQDGPAQLNVALRLGVCSDVCIPVSWSGILQLDPTSPSASNGFRIQSAKAIVPQTDDRASAPFAFVGYDAENNLLVLPTAEDPLSNKSLIVDLPNKSLLFDLPHSRPELGAMTVASLGGSDLSTLLDQEVRLIYDSKQGPYSKLVKIELVKVVDETLIFE